MLKLDAEESDGDDADKAPPTAQSKGSVQATENNVSATATAPTPTKQQKQSEAAGWNAAFLKSISSSSANPPPEVSLLTYC